MNILWVFLGGGLGSLCRYSISLAMSNYDTKFPWATFIANAISCIILGFLISLSLKEGLNSNLKLLLITGFCGGFSTFSTFSYETFHLLEQGLINQAMLNIAGSIFVCLLCIFIGLKLGQSI